MEYLISAIKQIEPIQYVLGIIAICGGMARYFISFTTGEPFSFVMLVASSFASGFSGWIFAQIGLSMHQPLEIVFVMAGVGGFFGEQTMKLALEFAQAKVGIPKNAL